MFLLDFATGLREGELLALDWDCIDLIRGTLCVKKSVKEVYVYHDENTKHIETIFQTPKTLNSFRTVSLPSSIIKLLNTFDNKKGLLFHDENNLPLKAKNVAYEWKRILKECNYTS